MYGKTQYELEERIGALYGRLVDALGEKANALREKARVTNEDADSRPLYDGMDFLHCLMRLLKTGHVTVMDLHASFGAPGDWGYGTPIGSALEQIYREHNALCALRKRNSPTPACETLKSEV